MHATASLDYRIHQMQLGSPRSPLNCQGLSLHLPHPSLQSSRTSSHISSPMVNPSRPQGSSYHQKPSTGPSYLTSSSSLSSHCDERSPNPYHPRPVSQRSYDGPDDGRRLSKTSLRISTSTMPQQEESENDMSSASLHRALGAPAVARRAKAHVPSACVNCKRKHLACETQRPCNRCLQAGKEATCVDVQHKKRGRPRLRDEETGRGVTYAGESTHPLLYPAQSELLGLQGVDQRVQPRTLAYREIRSHSDVTYGNSRGTYVQSPHNFYASSVHGVPSLPSNQDIPETNPTALLSLDFVILRCNYSFSEALCLHSRGEGQSIKELLIPSEREKVQRLQNSLHLETQEKAHLPSIRSTIPNSSTFDLLSATAGFQPRPEYWTFRLPNEQSRGFPISISLARTNTHFLVLTLVSSAKLSISLPSTSTSQSSWPAPLPSPIVTQGFSSPSMERSSVPQLPLSYQQTSTNHKTVGHTAYRRSPTQQTDSGTSPSARSASTARSSVNGSDTPRDRFSNLQLPPIRTSGISKSGSDSKGGSNKGSPQSAARQKRRRVDIGEILR